ncbi:MAG: CD225/dispanin family protein [Duncaniella sp.]|nr:CD225/dispanin family protein [Duncaniella sp.]MDE7145046.1 CD225/dispanin family protein [Duncaniella sp.]
MKYWIIIDNVQMGPLTFDEVREKSGLTLDTPVWHEGMSDWSTVRMVPELAALFNVSIDPSGGYNAAGGMNQGYNPGAGYNPAGGMHQGYNQASGYQQPYGYQGGYNAYQPQGGYQYAPGQQPDNGRPPMPNNYLAWAIVVTICCCIVTGIVAIVYASKVSPAYYRGDYLAAQKASERASMWVIISFVLGLIVQPFYTLFTIMNGSGTSGLF